MAFEYSQFWKCNMNTVFPRIVSAETILFLMFGCGNYSKEETIKFLLFCLHNMNSK